MKYNKPALTFEEQIKKLSSRGLTINDKESAYQTLMTVSYYRLSAYWYPYRQLLDSKDQKEDFIKEATLNDAIELYEFDRKLRLLILDAIERVEVHVRTLITYHLGHRYGAFGHISSSNFHPKFDHVKWLKKLNEDAHHSRDCFIAHYRKKYNNFPNLPIWMVTEIMSFGNLSKCYKGLKNKDKKSVSNDLGIHHKRLQDWLHVLSYIRNACAHHSRIWNKELSIRPELIKDDLWCNPPLRNDRIFYVLLMLRSLLNVSNRGDQWANKVTQLIEDAELTKRLEAAMGLPSNWKSHPLWSSKEMKNEI